MKHTNTLLSLALLVTAISCQASSKKEEYIVRNSTGFPIYVGLYMTDGSGKVTDQSKKTFLIRPGEYATFPKQTSRMSSISTRKQTFFFSAALDNLAQRVVKNSPGAEYVFSSNNITPDPSMYKIVGTIEALQLSPLGVEPRGARTTMSYNLKKAFEKNKKLRAQLEAEEKEQRAAAAAAKSGKATESGATSVGLAEKFYQSAGAAAQKTRAK
jgi:hypothetical protein